VYPALAAVNQLKQTLNVPEIIWVGSRGGMEQALVERAGLTFEAIPAMGVRGKNPVSALRALWMQARGYRHSRRLIRRFQPQAVFVTGGYVCVPVTLAARRAGVPVIIYLPDIEPGLAIKFLARFARRVAVTAPEAQQFFEPGLTVVTGYPVRADLPLLPEQAQSGKVAARQRLGLHVDMPVLLAFGGSRGARSLNQAITGALDDYLPVCQIVHVSGTLDAAWVQARRAALPPELAARYHPFAYLHNDMVAALQAADLVVSRAGASTLGEFPAVGLPAILVPYPYAGAHQARNAAYLARHGAAVVINDADLSGQLQDTVMNLLTNPEKLETMRQASRQLAQPEAAAHLARHIVEVGTYAN
jgi:UDP-N-acetylglucosamine--N-acetylmuramyl-(pentapeptide) pyrophosphoryl-undecaprenol N-acetylglucosamine transferase